MKIYKWIGDYGMNYLKYLAYNDNYAIGLFCNNTKTTNRETLSPWINDNLTKLEFDNGQWIEVIDPKEISQIKMKLL